ncbi:MAG TPA: spherulation-specific family 4 protein [Pirellulales bacterium]|nr:spherulation-specific family 4 protein [Pirellulales bacterium]
MACSVGVGPAEAYPPGRLTPVAKIKLFVPTYFYPAGEGLKEWERLISAAQTVPIVAIANPASGPGDQDDPNHANIIGRATQAGVTVIGYVSTQYTKKPREQVKAEVDRWTQLYPAIQGIFFDEQSSDAAQVDYYRELFDYARKKIKNGFVASNPGVACDVAYLTVARPDLICVFEHHQGFEEFNPPTGWGDDARRHAAVVPYQTADAAQMRDRLRRTAQLHLGYFYATDDGGANPWDRLPTYWDDEVAAVRELNRARNGRE